MVEAIHGRGSEEKVEAKEGKGEVRGRAKGTRAPGGARRRWRSPARAARRERPARGGGEARDGGAMERRREERSGVAESMGGREMGIERAGLSLLCVCVRGGGRRMEGIEEGRQQGSREAEMKGIEPGVLGFGRRLGFRRLDGLAWSLGQNGLLSFPFAEKERKKREKRRG